MGYNNLSLYINLEQNTIDIIYNIKKVKKQYIQILRKEFRRVCCSQSLQLITLNRLELI